MGTSELTIGQRLSYCGLPNTDDCHLSESVDTPRTQPTAYRNESPGRQRPGCSALRGAGGWDERKTFTIHIGTERVILDKLFGPTIFANLRITPDIARGWVIERQIIKTGEYIEWVTIPAQIAEEFIAWDALDSQDDPTGAKDV